MEKVQILEQKYRSLMEEKDLLFFCKSLASYIDYLQSTQPFKKCLEKHTAEYDKHIADIDRIEAQVLKEMVGARDHLLSVVKKRKLDVKNLKRYQTFAFNERTDLFEEFDGYLNGRAVGNGFASDALERCLFDIAANLLKLGFKKDINQYEVSADQYSFYRWRIKGKTGSEVTGNIYGNFIFSSTFPTRNEYVEKFERERTFSPWGSFVELIQFKRAYDVVVAHQNAYDVLREGINERNKICIVDLVKMIEISQELESLVQSTLKWTTRNLRKMNAPEIQTLSKNDLKKHIEIVHDVLITGEIENTKGVVSFDPDRSILLIGEKEIKIKKLSEQYHSLRIIFEDPDELRKEWFYSEIAEKLDEAKGYTDKHFQNYFHAIKRRVATEGIKDLFITTNQSVKMNPTYLS